MSCPWSRNTKRLQLIIVGSVIHHGPREHRARSPGERTSGLEGRRSNRHTHRRGLETYHSPDGDREVHRLQVVLVRMHQGEFKVCCPNVAPRFALRSPLSALRRPCQSSFPTSTHEHKCAPEGSPHGSQGSRSPSNRSPSDRGARKGRGSSRSRYCTQCTQDEE